MSWHLGNQNVPFEDKHFNDYLIEKYGDKDFTLEESKVIFYEFLRNNITYATEFLLGVQLFPFQHLMINAMMKREFTLGIVTRGGAKSYSTAIFAALWAYFNQGTRIGIISATFRQCASANTLIPTTYGIKPISKIRAGDIVLSSNGKFNKVYDVWENPASELMSIKTKFGFEIEGKPEHKILVYDNGYLYKELKSISKKDKICILPSSENTFSQQESVGKNDAYLAGLLLGDGYCKGDYRYCLSSFDEETQDFIMCNYEANCYDNNGKYYLRKSQLSEDFNKNLVCQELATDKYMPEGFWKLNKKDSSLFLKGLFDSDGYFDKATGAGFSTSSKRLAKEVQIALLNFGIISSFSAEKARGKIKICGVDTIGRESYKVRITSVCQCNKFKEKIGFGLTRKKIALDKFLKDKPLINKRKFPNPLSKTGGNCHITTLHPDSGINTDYFYDGIRTITQTSEGITYDISVENDPSYIGNGFVNHNSRGIFKTIEDMASKPGGELFRQCLVGKPKHDQDEWSMQVGTSSIHAVPLGCLKGDSMVAYQSGLRTIHDDFDAHMPGDWIDKQDMVWSDGKFRHSDKKYYNGTAPTKKITTQNGYSLEGTLKHKIKVLYIDNVIRWKNLEDIKPGDQAVIDRSEKHFDNLSNIDPQRAYLLGQQSLDHIPHSILTGGNENIVAYLCGLFDQEDNVSKTSSGHFIYQTTLWFSKQIQQCLLHLGVICSRQNTNGKYEIIIDQENLSIFFGRCLGDTALTENDPIHYETITCVEDSSCETFDISVPENETYCVNGFVSHNSGEKLRGYRFQCLIIDELLLIPSKVYKEVLLPFLVVKGDVQERREIMELEDKLIKLGKLKEEDRIHFPNNKIIGLSSASYEFEFLYELYNETNESIFETEAERIKKMAKDDAVNKGSGGQKKAIFQFNYEMIPKALFDFDLIQSSKESMSASQFAREFGAQFTKDSGGFYSMQSLKRASMEMGQPPFTEIKGDPKEEYILSVDSSWSKGENADDFAIQVFKLDKKEKHNGAILVHTFALPSQKQTVYMDYLFYLYTNFNVVAIFADYFGGMTFFEAVNVYSPFKDKNIEFKEIEGNFHYNLNDARVDEEMKIAKKSYNKSEHKILYFMKTSADWARIGNEKMQADIEHKRLLFASDASKNDREFEKQCAMNIGIEKLTFLKDSELNKEYSSLKEKSSKQQDFVEHIFEMIENTKEQCALIEVSSTPTGQSHFDLPQKLKREHGPNKTRKDSYSALLFGNWGVHCYYRMMDTSASGKFMGFVPFFAGRK